MSSAGLHAEIFGGGREPIPALLIGHSVPRLHHSDGKPVYLVVEHARGVPIICRDGQHRQLLAYPTDWPGPGERSDRVIFAKHERLPWEAPIPCFDARDDAGDSAPVC